MLICGHVLVHWKMKMKIKVEKGITAWIVTLPYTEDGLFKSGEILGYDSWYFSTWDLAIDFAIMVAEMRQKNA